ncbi:MAG: hypothetical protein HND55_15395 [Pseudomonadota bacterium]|nr:MAG: hypothetical protein HND55_00065 [Pseudomonadota bacterium]QKK03915.1 MAG: hypothetical protein HND55_15395 [Pseudomonadota bacterium]
MDDNSRMIKRHFQALRTNTDHLVAPLERVLTPQSMPQHRRAWRLSWSTAAAMALAAIAWLATTGPEPLRLETGPFSGPTDFLLADARRDDLSRTPSIHTVNTEKTVHDQPDL